MEPVVSDAKVVKIRQNLEAVVRYAIEFLGDTLEHAPPRRTGRYEIQIKVCIEEIGEHGEEVGRFEFEQEATKLVVVENRVRH